MILAVLVLIGLLNVGFIIATLLHLQKNACDSDGLVQYDVYFFRGHQMLYSLSVYGLFGAFIGYVFYRSIYAVLIIGMIMMWFIVIQRRELMIKRKEVLLQQFKDAIYIVSTSLSVGKSLMNAIDESARELGKIYLGENAFMVKELEVMYMRLSMNSTVESVFKDFSDRANVEDIRHFSNILRVGKSKGANINELIRKTSQVIGDKIQIQKDMTTIMTAKRFELRIMTVMPIFFIAFITKSSPELMEPVYTVLLGRIAMTLALILFGTAYFVGERIVRIEV